MIEQADIWKYLPIESCCHDNSIVVIPSTARLLYSTVIKTGPTEVVCEPAERRRVWSIHGPDINHRPHWWWSEGMDVSESRPWKRRRHLWRTIAPACRRTQIWSQHQADVTWSELRGWRRRRVQQTDASTSHRNTQFSFMWVYAYALLHALCKPSLSVRHNNVSRANQNLANVEVFKLSQNISYMILNVIFCSTVDL